MCNERDQFNDKYQAKKWQLAAAINSMPQGLIMLDGKAAVVAMKANKSRLFSGDVANMSRRSSTASPSARCHRGC
ncbi:hypothetical protein ACVWZ4_005200 [Bradyrhizobium sp. USDA 4472]